MKAIVPYHVPFFDVCHFTLPNDPTERATVLKYWKIKPIGSYEQNVRLGDLLATEYLRYLRDKPEKRIGTLPKIIAEMPTDPNKLKGIEAGFLAGIDRHLVGIYEGGRD